MLWIKKPDQFFNCCKKNTFDCEIIMTILNCKNSGIDYKNPLIFLNIVKKILLIANV